MPQLSSETPVPQNKARYILSFALICIAVSVSYFSYTLLKVVDKLPAIIASIDKASDEVTPLVTEVKGITVLVPDVLTEVEKIRLQIPGIVEEVREIRTMVPLAISEIEKIRAAIPPIIKEVTSTREEIAKVREQIPPLLAEFKAYQAIIPDILTEVEQTRAMVPPTLDHVSSLIDRASDAGKNASEGAVSGFFTGVVKMPFGMISNLSGKVFSRKDLSKSDIKEIADAALNLVKNGKDGDQSNWINNKKDLKSIIAVTDTLPPKKSLASFNFQKCRNVTFSIHKNGTLVGDQKHQACLNTENTWEWVSE